MSKNPNLIRFIFAVKVTYNVATSLGPAHTLVFQENLEAKKICKPEKFQKKIPKHFPKFSKNLPIFFSINTQEKNQNLYERFSIKSGCM